MSHPHDEEILDLVNEGDEIIGTIARSRVNPEGIRNIRVINAFIKNDEGKIWIPRRAADKTFHPLGLDMSVGGFVSSGETYEQTLVRETMEEVRIDLNVTPYRFLAKFTPHEDDMHAFQQVYEIDFNQDPDYNKDDFVEAFWMTPQEVIDRIEAGEDAKSDLPKLIKKIYLTPMAG